MDSKKFLQVVEDKKRILEKKESPLKWQQKLEETIKATTEKEKKLKLRKHRRSYSSSESDSESESDGDQKHMKRKDSKRHRKHGHSDSDGATRRKHRSKRSSDSSDEEERHRKKHTGESIADTLQGKTLMLQTTAATMKSGGQPRRIAIPGAAGAATGHQTTTPRRRAGQGTGSVTGESDGDTPSYSDNHKRHRSRSMGGSSDGGAAAGEPDKMNNGKWLSHKSRHHHRHRHSHDDHHRINFVGGLDDMKQVKRVNALEVVRDKSAPTNQLADGL